MEGGWEGQAMCRAWTSWMGGSQSTAAQETKGLIKIIDGGEGPRLVLACRRILISPFSSVCC